MIWHIKKACYAMAQTGSVKSTQNRRQQQKHKKYVEAEEETDLWVFAILSITSEDAKLYKKTLSVADVDLEMVIDTGAARSVIQKTETETLLIAITENDSSA